ncbi:MAG: DUF1573 domain-containing protein [Crocinitomicaceae bacterium]|nr:DUF1573 domain-containing protein [Crocinitomicaceae bacterium]
MNKIILTVSTIIALSSCGDNVDTITKKSGEVTSSISAGSQSESELKEELEEIRKAEEQRIADEKANVTTISFDKLKFDFGNVEAQKENKTAFIVENTGDKPLIISDVSASCGCTMPQKPEEPILPGQTDLIEVVFKSKPGQKNEIKKTITVTANTEEKIHMLEIRAFVK